MKTSTQNQVDQGTHADKVNVWEYVGVWMGVGHAQRHLAIEGKEDGTRSSGKSEWEIGDMCVNEMSETRRLDMRGQGDMVQSK